MTSLKRLTLLGFLAFAVGAGCNDSPTPPTLPEQPVRTGPIQVVVSSHPAAWLVAQVGGAEVVLENVLPPGQEPRSWSPSGDDVAKAQTAELIVANGAGFEQWMATATLPTGRVVDSARGLDHIYIQGATHSHGKDGEHSHAEPDPHTWTDPLLFLQQAEAVHAALTRARPDKKAEFDKNLGEVRSKLTTLDRQYKDALTPGKSAKLAANHPAYNYLARRYDLDIRSFELDPETVGDASSVAAFMAWAETVEKPRHLMWDAQPTDAVRRSLPTGTLHVYIDPLEQPADGQVYDYVRQAEQNVSTFKSLFKKSPPSTPAETTP